MAKNNMQWSSATPGLLVILLDQSGSMLEDYSGQDSKTVYASRAVNKCIDNIIQKNFNGDKPKNRCFISVIGYNHNVNPICDGWLTELDAKPLRLESLKQKQPDGAGGIIEVDIKQPVWVDPITQDGATNMKGALEAAKQLVEDWISKKPDNPAPVIINISDGVPYYDGKEPRICMQETTQLAKTIMQLSNADGNVLIFNAQIEKNGQKIVFPNSSEGLCEEAKFLYEISSEIPDSYKDAAKKNDLDVKNGSKGCIFQADDITLVQLIDFGSSKGQGDKGLN